MRRLVLIALCMILLLACCGCSSKADKEEIEALKSEIVSLRMRIRELEAKQEVNVQEESNEEELVYIVESDDYAKLITIKELYTEEQMLAITKKEAEDFREVYFFLSNAPKEQNYGFRGKGLIPDKDYAVARFAIRGVRWKLIK